MLFIDYKGLSTASAGQ